MKLSIMRLKDDIINDRSDMFFSEFPKAKVKFLDLKDRPSCAICIRNSIMAMMDDKEFEKKLETIYGEPVELEEDLVKLKEKGDLEMKRVDVFKSKLDDWEAVASDYMKRNGSRVEYISTAYDPSKDQMIATVFLKNITVRAPNRRKEHLPVSPDRAVTIPQHPSMKNAPPQPPMNVRSDVIQPTETGRGPSIENDPHLRGRNI
jgi:hypothetical protein